MVGRITSFDAPAVNEHGVSYRHLLEVERESNDRLVERLEQALKAWQLADAEPGHSRKRRVLLDRARQLTTSALS